VPASKVHVRVVHDNVSNASHPVLVGHYRHDVIVGAERYLDQRLDGRLSALLRMELYAGLLNTAVVVLNEQPQGDMSLHPGVIVAGLGVVGDLSPARLTATIAQAMTMYGADCVGFERRRRQRMGQRTAPTGSVPAPVTTVLVGSGEGGLALPEAIQALLRAVSVANERLRRARRDGAPDASELVACIGTLDILELYEDRAIEATRLLREVSSLPEFDTFEIEPLLVAGNEGQRRARFGEESGWWQRVRLTGDEHGALEFEAVTHTARVKATLVSTQRQVVEGLVEQAIETTAYDAGLGHTLFEMLVPNEFKSYAAERRRMALLMNPEAAALPWELMQSRFEEGTEPLSVSTGMLRQLLVSDAREQPLRSPGKTALVIGNPVVSDTRFPSLDQAKVEAQSVATLIAGHGYDVQALLETEAHPLAVYSAVHDKPWRILHIAAHGVFEFTREGSDELVSGVVLDGAIFTAADADQMSHVPDVIFINCCYLGQTKADATPRRAHRLAANLATQFIRMGARAVVAAGWAVDDAAAKTFATTFYGRLLDGALFGDAIIDARKETFARHGVTNTWGAYQCYGDPSFSLVALDRQRIRPTFVAARELIVWLEAFESRAREDQGDEKALRDELLECEKQVPAAWWSSAETCAAAGKAFAELGQLERAIDYFTRASTAEEASAPIWVLEQLASCKIKYAGELACIDAAGLAGATQLLDEAEETLRHLLALGRSSERLALQGALMKRRALLAGTDPVKRKAALEAMSRAYGEAFKRSCSDRQPLGVAYPLANQIAAEIILGWQGSHGTSIPDLLEALQKVADAQAATHTDFFSLAAVAECALLRALREPALDDTVRQEVQDEYLNALSRGITTRQLDSVRTMFGFFITLIAAEYPEGRLAPVAKQLSLIEQALVAKA
jgi:tetratricopeptide (TPR) repeat protein